jgi:hypothetical protein
MAALELQLTNIIGVAPPPSVPRPGDVVAPTPPLVVDDTFKASTIACLHTQAIDILEILSLVFIILGVSSTHYARWHDLVLLINDFKSSD